MGVVACGWTVFDKFELQFSLETYFRIRACQTQNHDTNAMVHMLMCDSDVLYVADQKLNSMEQTTTWVIHKLVVVCVDYDFLLFH